jgi:hypothetical protein
MGPARDDHHLHTYPGIHFMVRHLHSDSPALILNAAPRHPSTPQSQTGAASGSAGYQQQ